MPPLPQSHREKPEIDENALYRLPWGHLPSRRPCAGQYRCHIGKYDLAEAMLFNGGCHAAPDAPPELKSAEEKARAAGRGLWER